MKVLDAPTLGPTYPVPPPMLVAGAACNPDSEDVESNIQQCGEGLVCYGANSKHTGTCVSVQASHEMPTVPESEIQQGQPNVETLETENVHTIEERTQAQLDSQLKDAAYYGELARVVELLKKGANPDSYDRVSLKLEIET